MFRRRPTLIESMTAAHASMVRTMMGTDPIVVPEQPKRASLWWFPKPNKWAERRRCNESIVWPTTNGGWSLFLCPADKGHKGLHEDENRYPGYHNADIAFFRRQYDVLFGDQ